MWFLGAVLAFTTALLCYAGYVFLIVDKRAETAMIEDEDLFAALDDKSYDFELPEEIDTYEELRESTPADKCVARRLARASVATSAAPAARPLGLLPQGRGAGFAPRCVRSRRWPPRDAGVHGHARRQPTSAALYGRSPREDASPLSERCRRATPLSPLPFPRRSQARAADGAAEARDGGHPAH